MAKKEINIFNLQLLLLNCNTYKLYIIKQIEESKELQLHLKDTFSAFHFFPFLHLVSSDDITMSHLHHFFNREFKI